MDFVQLSSKASQVGQWAAAINAVCKQVPTVAPCQLGAHVIWESRGQNVFQQGVKRGPGCGVGLGQITAPQESPGGEGVVWADINNPYYLGPDGKHYVLLDPQSNLYVAAKFFLERLNAQAAQAQKESPISFSASCHGQIVYAAAAGYNAGWGAVEEALAGSFDANKVTYSKSYASDVFGEYNSLVKLSHS